MKNDLTCGVVRDLLPNYIDGLLCVESRQAVDRHLADCSACAAALAAMRAQEPSAEEQTREVDYLKRVKLRNNRKIIAAVVCTAVVLVTALLAKLFLIGAPLQPQSVAITETAVVEDTLHLSLMSVGSGNAFHGWHVETENGIASIYARDVLVSPLYSSGDADLEISLEGVREVWLGGVSGRLLWQDGVVISPLALELMEARAPYCGDPAASARIAEILRLPDRLGSYTFSLQTDKHPYEVTLEFGEQPTGEQLSLVTCYNLLTLALVDNLESSLFKRPAYGDLSMIVNVGMELDGVNDMVLPALVEEYNAANGADWEPKASIKDYTRSPADLQRLLMILDSFYKAGLTTRGG